MKFTEALHKETIENVDRKKYAIIIQNRRPMPLHKSSTLTTSPCPSNSVTEYCGWLKKDARHKVLGSFSNLANIE